MRKSIRKPQNWQDFETLCKMLWGEMWGIQDKIKKNGRLGQPQSGVDVYGVPKGKTGYSGIQCKGKDDYTNFVLSRAEIDREVENAKKFNPLLETFIFSTSANKDVAIEEYVRKKDLESRLAGGFEILIFCWEDIADLIETHRDTFNYYALNNQFKSNYELSVTFENGSDRFIIQPKFKKSVTKYILRPPDLDSALLSDQEFVGKHFGKGFVMPQFKGPAMQNINNSWASFGIKLQNTGSMVLEDYRLNIFPEEGKFRKISRFLNGVLDKINYLKHSPLHVDEDNFSVIYKPDKNSTLIQKDSKSFDLHFWLYMKSTK